MSEIARGNLAQLLQALFEEYASQEVCETLEHEEVAGYYVFQDRYTLRRVRDASDLWIGFRQLRDGKACGAAVALFSATPSNERVPIFTIFESSPVMSNAYFDRRSWKIDDPEFQHILSLIERYRTLQKELGV